MSASLHDVMHPRFSCSSARRQTLLITWGHALQVVYPALEAKIRNVTLAYSVEHEDEVSYAESVPAHVASPHFC